MIRTSAFVALVAVPIAACGKPAADLSGGDQPLTVEAEPLYSLGGMNAVDWQLFGEGIRVAFGGDGALRILDGDNFRLLAIDESGSLLWESGSQGGGPGEFGMPMSMAVAPDGSSTIYDLGHQALVQVSGDGAYVDQTPHGMDQGIPSNMIADPEGGVVFSGAGAITMRRDESGTVAEPEALEGEPIRRVLAGDRDGVLYEAWRLPPTPMETSGSLGGSQMTMPALRAFEPELFYAPLPDGRLVVVDSVDYAVKVVAADGSVERVLRRPIDPKPVGRAEQEAEKQRRLGELEETGGPQVRMITRGGSGGSSGGMQTPGRSAVRDMMMARLESMEFADEIPVITAMRVDPWSGQIWVRRAAEGGIEAGSGGDGPIDVLTADGDYLGTLAAGEPLPDAFGPGGLVAYLSTDEFDVTSVEVVRISGLR